jgi:hypothetical protein
MACQADIGVEEGCKAVPELRADIERKRLLGAVGVAAGERCPVWSSSSASRSALADATSVI